MDELSLNFWRKVNIRTLHECWPWKASVDKDGYGQFWVGDLKTFKRSHRFAYENYYDVTIKDGMCVCHRCDNPGCCNPRHLFEGTIQDNIDNKMEKGRHGYGTNSRYTEDEVTLIRLLYSTGMSTAAIARRFESDQGSMWRLLHNPDYKPKEVKNV